MRTRNIMWLTVLNIFLMLLVSVFEEYASLESRFQNLQTTVSTALDTAVDSAIDSEEMFSKEYKQQYVASQGVNDSSSAKTSKLRIWTNTSEDFEGDLVDGNWVEGDTYAMAMFFNKKKRFPSNQSELNTFTSGNCSNDENVYEWLFGSVSSREPQKDFKEYYTEIGNRLKGYVYVKNVNTSDGTYTVDLKEIPILAQMGLNLDSSVNDNPSVRNEYLNKVVHKGKFEDGFTSTEDNSSYYLTPYSLGVTYVPVKVVAPAFMSHLDQLVRYNKLKGSKMSDIDIKRTLSSGTGCIKTSIYDGGTQSKKHVSTHNTDITDGYSIINDGQIEYDLSTVKVRVDYNKISFYDEASSGYSYDVGDSSKNYKVVNRIEGAVPYTKDLYLAPKLLFQNDTWVDYLRNYNTSIDGVTMNQIQQSADRLVAKVTVKMKIHVPYQSFVMQWFRYLYGSKDNNHYDMRLWKPTNANGDGEISMSSDGVWYQYSTYVAISR